MGARFRMHMRGAGPIGPVVEGLAVGPLYDGTGDSGNPSPPDPAADVARRKMLGSKPQPGGDLMYPPECSIMTGDMEVMFQAELTDPYENSPTFGRPMKLHVDFYWENATPHTVSTRSTRGGVTPWLNKPWAATGYWATLNKPSGFEFVTPGGPGCEAVLWVVVRPDDEARFDTKAFGPYKFYPRTEDQIVVKQMHKTRPVAGNIVRNMVDVLNAAVTEFEGTGKAVVGEWVDHDKAWAIGRRGAEYSAIPWLTQYRPGLDLDTGLLCKATLGDPENWSTQGYWSPGVNRLMYCGFHHDVGKSGGIQIRSVLSSHVVMFDHDTYCTSFPAAAQIGATVYSDYGSGTGAAALIRHRLANGAPLKPYTTNPNTTHPLHKLQSFFGNFHDLPAKAIETYQIDFMNDVDNVSGTAVGNAYGSKYGGITKRFGGFYSGITTRAGDVNPGLRVMFSGGQGWYGVRKNNLVGQSVDPLTSTPTSLAIFAGSSKAAAVAAGPIASFACEDYKTLAALAAEINANAACIAAGVTSADIHGSGPDLDCTHLWMPDLDQSSPVDDGAGGPYAVTGTSIDLCVHADVHANGMGWASATQRVGVTVRDAIWCGYCGAGEVAVSTNDGTSGKFWDFYFTGCCWWNEMGFTNRNSGWTHIGAQGGRVIGDLDGVAFAHCVVAGGGRLYTTSEKPKRYVTFGYIYGEIGDISAGVGVTGLVSNTWKFPSGATNSKHLLEVAGPSYDDTQTFADAPGGDFNLKPGTNALLPDGVNYAGKFDPSGADLSLIDY